MLRGALSVFPDEIYHVGLGIGGDAAGNRMIGLAYSAAFPGALELVENLALDAVRIAAFRFPDIYVPHKAEPAAVILLEFHYIEMALHSTGL
jgi:hypothetical protein